tara:strand:+ start:41 stop:280 length:240 start_codon:yes stop_codon:yes gene_type:complete
MVDSSNNIRYEETIKLICRQTNYSKQEAEEKYKEWDYDYINVIKEYINPDFNKIKQKKGKTMNQKIMTEIRYFCNNIIK